MVNQIKVAIEDYFLQYVTFIEKLNLQPLYLNNTDEIIKNLRSMKIPYKETNGLIEISYFQPINKHIESLNKFEIKTNNDVRLYINRLIRLKYQIDKIKYKISQDFYKKAI